MPGLFADDNPLYGGPPLAGHSLSWKDEKKPHIGPNKTLYAKIWIPENPSDSNAIETENELSPIDSTVKF